MSTRKITLEIPEEKYVFFEELCNQLNLTIIANEVSTEDLALLTSLQKSIGEVKLMKEGKLPKRTIDELFK